jgi:hypothetical protein
VPSQQEVVDIMGPILLMQGSTYRKSKRAFLRQATSGEKVTTLFNGKVETQNVAKEGDWIVRADTSTKELYILQHDTVVANYVTETPLDISGHLDAQELEAQGYKAYASVRQILAIRVDEEILQYFPMGQFVASWGESMAVELDDYLCCGEPSHDGKVQEVYRVQSQAFSETYARLARENAEPPTLLASYNAQVPSSTK